MSTTIGARLSSSRLPHFDPSACPGQREPEYRIWTALLVAMGIESYVELGSTYPSVKYIRDAGIPRVVSVDILHDDSTNFGDIKAFGGNSHGIETLVAVLNYLGGDPDAVFIDADHDGDAPRRDFDLWWPHATRLLGFHDILIPNIERDLWPDVSLRFPSAKIIGCDYGSALAWQGPGTPKDGRISGGGIGILWK